MSARRPPARCVLHPSAVVTAFFGVRAAKVLEAWRRGDVVLCVSDAVMTHYRDLATTFDMWPDELDRFLCDVEAGRDGATVEWCAPAGDHRAPAFDTHPEDSDIATCARAAGAPVVCVDRHLLADEGGFGVIALTPVDFVTRHVARPPRPPKPTPPPGTPQLRLIP